MQNRLKRFYKILILLLVIPGLIAITPIESQSKAKKSTTSVKRKLQPKRKKKKNHIEENALTIQKKPEMKQLNSLEIILPKSVL
jgi:hypothetical protein